MELTYILLIGFTLLLFYKYLTKNYDYWKNRNVPCVPNPIPIFGNILSLITEHSLYGFANYQYRNTEVSMLGFYYLRRPALLIRDADVVKSVMETNFSNFRFNLPSVTPEQDPIIAKHPFFSSDYEDWKERRSAIGSGVSGKKLYPLYTIAHNVALELCDYLDRKIRESGGLYECDLKSVFVRYTGEFVANSSFGVDGQSFLDDPEPTSFIMIAKDLFELNFLNGLRQWVVFYLPDFSKLLRLNLMPKRTSKYFRDNIKSIIKKRQQMKEKPDDFLQSCIEICGENDLDTLIAYVAIYYNDTYDAISSALAHLFYQISLNPEIQERLRSEVASKLNGNPVTYESLKGMPYLDKVLNEVLRISAPECVLTKVCNEEVTLTGYDGLQVKVEPGCILLISMMNMHLDERYWPNPDVFDPERFDPENENSYNKNAYFPFGDGPRQCAGRRFALTILKLVTAVTITRYSLEPSNKTKTPLEVDPDSMLTLYKGSVWAKLRKLETSN